MSLSPSFKEIKLSYITYSLNLEKWITKNSIKVKSHFNSNFCLSLFVVSCSLVKVGDYYDFSREITERSFLMRPWQCIRFSKTQEWGESSELFLCCGTSQVTGIESSIFGSTPTNSVYERNILSRDLKSNWDCCDSKSEE